MANDLVKLPQLSTHAETKGKILSFHAGQTATVKMEQGLHYILRRAPKGDATTPLEVPDNVIASRQGDALHLRYSDSSTITFENFYSVCTTDSACSVNLVGDTENGITLSASNAAGGSVSGDTGTLVYAHGNHDVLMSMAQGQSNMAGAFTALGESPVVTYFPQTLAMEAAGLAPASAGFAAVPALIGGSILMGTGSAGTGSAGNGVAAPSIVNGSIQAGPVISGNDLLVNIYAGDKTTLLKANVLVDASGHFTTNVGSYVGVVFAQLVVTGTALDYMDEATGVGKNLSSALTAMGVVRGPGSTLSLNLNVLTTIAANKIDPNASVATVNGVNKAVATTFGLTDLQGPVVTTVLSTYNAADGLSAAENYGAVLAALSGMDKLNGGDVAATINQLTGSIALSGSGSSSATTMSDAGKYNIAAGAKVVILADSGTVTNQFGSAVATLINYAANPTTGTLGLTAIGNATDSAVGTVPTQFDYANANVTGIDSSVKLQLINDVVKSLVLANVDTVGEVQSLSDAVTAVINSPAGGTPPTWVQLNALGILGITSGNLSAVLAAIANTSPDGSAVDTQAELQALVNTINTAVGVLSSYAQANTASAPATPTGTAPLLGNYSAAGITGVDSSNLHAINDALATAAITGTQADTPAKIQTIVNAYNAILASADGNAATAATALTAAQFAAIGADIGLAVSSPQILSLLDDSIGRKTAAAVDSVAEVNQLAAAANAVANQAAGISGLTMADLAALGITGITDALGATGSVTALSAANIQSILSAISGTPDTGTGVDTLAKIQALVNAAVDLTPPMAPVITAIAGDNTINAAEQGAAVSGTAEAHSVITITLGGTSHSVTTDASGNWSYALQPADISAMGQGTEVISVTATDAAGNISPAGTRTIRVDTLAPTLAMGVIAGDAILNKTEHDALSSTTHLQISGSTTGVEDGQVVAITLNYLQYSATVTGNAWTLNLPNADALALNHGNSYSAIASVSDAAGNVSNVGSSAVLIDIAAPDIPTVHQKVTNNTRPTLSGHAEKTLDAGLSFLKLEVATSDVISVLVNGITYTLTLGGTSSPAGLTYNTGTGDWALDLSGAANPMTNGNYEVAVSVTAAGLTKGDISSNELKINTTGVVVAMAGITSDDAVNAAEKGGTVLLHGTSSNLEAGQTVDLTLVDGSIVHATVQADGSWSTLVAGSSFNAEGAQSVTANATNAAGTSATPLVHNLLVDSVAPTATVVLANSALLAGQTSTVTITFSEAVSGFDNNDLNVGNGTLSAVSSVDGGITWTATFTPSGNVVSATNAITLNKTGVSDAAGNAGVGSSSSANYAIDTHRPTAAITLSDTALKAGETATATITFSEAVTGFDNGDLSISNGVLSAVSSGDGGITWTATFTPTTDFTAASNFITLSNSGVSNTAGNAGAGQTSSASYAVDTHTPVVTAVTDSATAAITRGTISFTVAFDETLAGAVGIGNFSATNGVITSVTPVDGSHYTVVVTPNTNVASGNVALSLVAAGLTDAAGNALANADLSGLDSQGVDTRAPSISSVTDNTVATVTNSAITYTVTFDEAVVGTIDRSSFGATSGSITSVNTVDNIHYTVVVTPTPGIASGNVALSFIANGQTDATGNPLANADLSGQNSQGIDTLAPSTPATAPASYADNAGSVVSAASGAAFTDDSTPGLVIGSLPVDASDAFLYVDGVKVAASYDAATGTLTPTTPLTEGPHSLSYSLTDLTGNESGRSAALTVTVDTTPPTAPAGAPGSFVDNSGTLQSASSAAATTDDTTPGIHIGTLPSGVTGAVLYVDGVPVAATYDAVTGALTPSVPLTEGAHTLGYGYVDASGNASASGPTLSITIDLTAPTAPVSAPGTYIDNTGTLQSNTGTAATTDDTQPGIAIGSLPAGVTDAVLYVDGVLVAATYDAATGALTPTVPLSEGVHTFGYGYVDAAGNASASGPTLSITVDVTPPTAPASAPVGYIDNTGTVQSATSTAATTDDTTPAINIGSLPSGVTDAVLYVDGVLVAATYDAATGALTPTAPLTEGAHTFGYGYVDVAGNASVSGPTLSITVDLTAPTAPATAPASYIDGTGTLQGNTSTAATADDTTPGIHIGSLPAAVTDAVLYVDGVQVAATYDAATGALTPTVPLAEGVHTFGYGYVDAAGNTSASGPTLSITIDLTAPTAPASAPANYIDNTGTVQGATSTAATTDDTTPGIAIGALPAGVTDAVLYVDGVLVAATYDAATGALTPTVPLSEGTHTFGFGYVDAAGNASASGPTLSITVDLTAPTAPAIAPTSYVDNTGTVQSTTSTATTTDDATPGINIGSLPSGVTDAVLYVDGVLVAATYDAATGALTPTVPLTEGAHTFGYGYVDAAGNASASGPTLSITIDLTAPTAPATAPANYIDNTGTVQSTTSTAATTDDTTPAINIGSLPSGVTDAVLYVDGVLVAATYDAATGALTPVVPLTEGAHTLGYGYVDAAGNASASGPTVGITVDLTAPTAPTAAPTSYIDSTGMVQSATSTAATTDDTTPAINIGSLPSGVTNAVLYVDGVLVAATYDLATGALTPTAPLTEGAHAFGYGYVDAAGNASASGPTLSITVDLTAPLAPVSASSTYIDNTGTLQGSTSAAATTDDTTPGINIGSLPSGVTDAVLYVDGVLVAATYDPATGALTPTVPLTEGAHTFGYGYVDAAGNASASGPTLSITVDVTPPTAPATAPTSYIDNTGSLQGATSNAATTDDTTPGINIGSLPSGVTDAVLYVDGVLVAATYDAATGALTPTVPLTEGVHTFGYGYVDAAGNASVSGPTLSITIDLTAPTAPATAPVGYIDNTGTVQGTISIAATTDDTTPGINIGSLPSGVTDAVLYVDGILVAATYDAATGALTPVVPLTEGAHTLGYGYVDAAGNVSTSGPTVGITVDLTAPTAPVAAPTSYIDNTGTVQSATSTAATTDDTTPAINIGSLPAGVTDAVLYVDGVLVAATYDAATGALTPTVPLSEGAHTFGFGYVDAAGNASASGPTLSITVDLTAPTAPVSAPSTYIDNTGTVQSTSSTATTTDDTTPGINIGSLPSGVTDAVLYVDGILVAATYDAATGALTPTVPLTEGAHTFGYGYVDAAGNASASGPTLSITVDLTAPTAPATAPVGYIDNTGTVQSTISISATTDDTTPGINIGSLPSGVTDAVLYVDGVLVAATYDAATGTLTPTAPLTEGAHTYGYGYVDAAGNASASGPTLNITIDVTPPTAPATAPVGYIDDTGTVQSITSTAATTDDTTPAINIGSLPSGVTDAVLYVDGVLVAATYDAATGALTPTVPLTEGAHTFGYGYVDAAGNASASGPTLIITVDLTAPTAPASAPSTYIDDTGTLQGSTSTAPTTDDTTPGINIGSLPSGVTDAVLYVDGVLVAATYDAATGALTPTVPLTEGTHTLGYGYVDAAGNASASGPTLSITVDLTAPTAPAAAPTSYVDSTGTVQGTSSTAATTDDTTPGINIGSLPTGVTDAVLYVDGLLVVATYDVATGALTPTVPLMEGTHTFGYGYVDAAGNASASGPTLSITVDLTAPTAPAAAPTSYVDSTGTVQGTSSTAATTDDTTPGINIGSLPSGVTDAVLYVDGVLVAATYDAVTGALTPTVPLTEGAHTLGFGYVDAAGNASASGPTLSITIDVTPPTAPASAPSTYVDNTGGAQSTTSAATTTDDTTPAINIGSLPSGVTDAVLYVDGVLVAATYDAATGALTPTVPLTEGAHTFGYGYVDAAGNASASGPTLSITVDLTAPTAPAAAPTSYVDNTGSVQNSTSTATTTDDTTPGINIGSLPSGVTDAVLYVDGVLVAATYDAATGALTPTVPLTEGAHTFGYGYVDAAGNASASGPTLSITIDLTAPTAPAAAPASYIDNTGITQNTTSTAATTDDTTPGINIGSLPSGVTDAVLFVDGVLVAATYDAATGALTPTVPLTEGAHTFGYGYVDAAGNASASGPTLSITIDLTAPAAPASAPTSYIDDTGTVQDAASTAATTDDTTPGINIGSLPSGVTDAVLYVDGVLVAATYDAATGALTPTVPLTEGTHTFGYGYVDAAGNTSSSGPTLSITVDLTAPTAPASAPIAYIDNTGITQSTTSTAATTDDTTPAINIGSLPSGVTDAVLYVDGVLVAATYDAATGALTPTAPLTEGTHTFGYGYVDAAGNASASGPTLSITVDLTAPTAPAAAPASFIDNTGTLQSTSSTAATTDDTTLAINIGSLPSGVTDAVLYVDGVLVAATYDAATGALTPTVPLTEGAHTFGYGYVDAAGNASASGPTLSITIDLTAPTAPTFNAVATDNFINANEQGSAIGGSAEPFSTITLTLANGDVHIVSTDASGNWSYTLQPADITAMGQGQSQISATATDAAGNVSSAGNHNVTLDTVAPTIALDPISGGTLDKTEYDVLAATPLAISGSTSGAENGQHVTVTLNGKSYDTTVTNDAWSVDLPLLDAQALNHGSTYTATASVADAAGNVSNVASANVVINIAFPDTPTVHQLITNSATPTISGHAEKIDGGNFIALASGDQLAVSVNGTPYILTVGGNSNPAGLSYNGTTRDWTLDLTGTTTMADGTYDVSVSVTAGSATQPDISLNEVTINTAPVTVAIATITGEDLVSAAEKSGNVIVHGSSTNLEAGALVHLTLVNGTTVDATVAGDGGWSTSVAGSTFSIEGAQHVIANATNAAGTSVNHTTNLTADHLVTVDTVAPVVTTITDSTSAALTNATISFTVTFDEAIFGTVDISSFSATHGSVTSVVSTDNIHYTVVVMPTAGIATDNVTLSLIANGQTDAAGNTMVSADLSAKDSQGIDTLAPSSPTLALHGDSGTSSSDGITNDNVVNVSGLESGATWQYQMDGGSWVTGSGTTFNLSSSAHAYAVRQTDAAGNTGAASGNYSYTLDTTAAIVNSLAITSATGAQNNYLNVGDVVTVTVHMSKTVTVTGTPRLGLTIGASIAQASYVSGSGSADLIFSYTIQTLRFDANGISIAANSLVAGTGTITDIAGNTAVLGHALVTDNASYRVDTVVTNPSFGLATDSGSSSTDKITNVATIDVTGLEAGATWQYSTDTGNSWTTGNGSTFALSTEQTYAVGTIQVKQTDLAGNTSTASSNNSGAWTYDHTAAAAPSLALHGDSGTSLTDGITNDAVISVGGLESGGTWQYSTDNGTSWSSAQSSSTTSFSLSTEQSYAIGSVQVRQTDVAGNVSNVASNVAAWTYDHTPPSDTLTTATLPVTSNAIAQSSEAGIAYLVATSVTVSTLADITGAADALWNQTTISAANSNTNMPLTGLNAGTYKLYSQDAAGNLSAASANTVTVHDAPVFSSTTIANNAALYTQSNVTLTPTYSNQTLTAGNLVTASGSTGVVTVVLNGVTYFRLGDLNATESVNLSFSSPVNTVVITWYLQTGNSDTNRFEDLSMSANGSPITFLAANLVAQTGMSISSTDPTKIVCVGQGGDSVTPAVYTHTGTGITSFSVTDNFRSGNPNGLDVKVAVSTPGFGTAVSNLAPAITADPGGTSIRGYAITAAAASSNDKWQYSTDGGTVWSDLTAASLSNAFYLAPTDTVRWTGKIDTESALSMVAVDNSGAALHAANAVAGTLDVTTRGGSTAYSANIATLAANATPLILDLNGDGVQTTTVDHGVLFDIANTGALNQTAWANANDGLLVRDINHDGVINNGAELFGNGTLLADGSHAANGFGALAQFDSNHDGKIDAQDAVFQELKVWRDTNGDGVSQANELLSMQELGIVSFNLSATQGSVMENGNTLGLVSSYTTADGAVHDLADVWFQQGSQLTLDTDAAGIHYLHLGTSGQPLDLTSVDTSRLHGVNVIDMLSNSTADSLTIALQQVLEMGSVNVVNHSTAGLSGGSYQFGATESRHQLMVSGDASDSIIVSGGFVDSGLSAVISGHIYEVYNHGSDAQLMVEQAMNRTLMG